MSNEKFKPYVVHLDHPVSFDKVPLRTTVTHRSPAGELSIDIGPVKIVLSQITPGNRLNGHVSDELKITVTHPLQPVQRYRASLRSPPEASGGE